jgi:hypothetical protein
MGPVAAVAVDLVTALLEAELVAGEVRIVAAAGSAG